MSAQAALRDAVRQLAEEGVPDPARDARLLLADALGVAPDRLTLHLHDPVPEAARATLAAHLAQRARRVPVSHILGRRLFWGRWFRVTPDVLDPRPETETLVAAALERPFSRVLDLGTGSGAILLTLLAERPDATGLGTDVSPRALAVAQNNAEALGLRAQFQQADWFDGITGHFDLIVSNPPYIAENEMHTLAPELAFEPRVALTPGGDGLDAYRALARGARTALAPGGRVLLEIGPTQAAAVSALLDQVGFAPPRVVMDLDGRDRVVVAQSPY